MNNTIWLGPQGVSQHGCLRCPRENHDSYFRKFSSYSQYDFLTAQLRQKKVDNGNIWRSLSKNSNRIKACVGLPHYFVLRETFEIATQQFTNSVVIIHYYNLFFHCHASQSKKYLTPCNVWQTRAIPPIAVQSTRAF